MKQLYLLYLCILISLTVSAQDLVELWFPGYVELKSGKQLKGELSYYSNEEHAFLQIRVDDKTYLFNGNQLAYFQFFDDLLEETRTFYALPFLPKDNSKTSMLFFEPLLVGPSLTVLSRVYFNHVIQDDFIIDKSVKRDMIERDMLNLSNIREEKPNITDVAMPKIYETIYLVTPGRPVEAYCLPTYVDEFNILLKRADKGLLLDLINDRQAQVKKYIKSNNLNLRRKGDLLRVVQYYNELKSSYSSTEN